MYHKHLSTLLRSAMAVALVTILTSTLAFSQVPTMNGTVVGDEALYGAALSTQNTETGFGDANFGDTVLTGTPLGGSEINQAFATVANGRLYVMITGNLEENFNKMSFFFDTVPGGHNQIDGSILPQGVDGFCCGGLGTTGGALQQQDGLKFDAGLDADYFLTFTHSVETALDDPNSPGNPIRFWAMSAHYSDMTATAPADRQNVAAGMQLAPQGLPNVLRETTSGTFADPPYEPDVFVGPTLPDHLGPALPNLLHGGLIDRGYALDPASGMCADDTGAGCLATELGFALDQSPTDPANDLSHRNLNNFIDLQMALDNSNIEGLPTSTADSAVTGLEFSIPLSELGNPTGDFRMVGFVNGVVHDFLSNQFIGDGILGENFGDPSTVDLSMVDGDQFVTIPYTPPTVSGDFNGDGAWDCTDINLLTAAVAAGLNDPNFDMNGDGVVDGISGPSDVDNDLVAWLERAGAEDTQGVTTGNPFVVGDANLDGVNDGLDFIQWNNGKFTQNTQWCGNNGVSMIGGNFNGDSVIDGLDFILWNAFKFTASSDLSAVPEPATGLMLLVGCLLFAQIRRR